MLIALVVGLVSIAQRRELSATTRKHDLLGLGVLLVRQLLGLVAWPLVQAQNSAKPASQVTVRFARRPVLMALLDAVGLVLLALAIVRRAP